MVSNRTILARPRKQASAYDEDVVREFVRLDHMRRGCADFKRGERALMRRLGLVDEFWSMNSPLDRSAGPCHPEGYVANDHWHRCREVRRALLAAARDLGLVDQRGHA
jgi:hypothetical protein